MYLTNEHEIDQDLLKWSLKGIIDLLKDEKKDKQKVKLMLYQVQLMKMGTAILLINILSLS